MPLSKALTAVWLLSDQQEKAELVTVCLNPAVSGNKHYKTDCVYKKVIFLFCENVLYIANASVLSSSLLQVRSRTVVHGKAATGVLPDRMSSPDTTGNTPEPNHSSASPAAAASLALITWPCT